MNKKQKGCKKLVHVVLSRLGTAPWSKAYGKPDLSLSTLLTRAEPLEPTKACQLDCTLPQRPKNYRIFLVKRNDVKM